MPAPNSNRGLELVLLGGFEVRLNGVRVAGVSYNKMRALLAYLAMEQDKDYGREALADLLWGGLESDTARGNLRRTLADLRKALELPSGKTLFSTDKQSIRLNSGFQVDARDFADAAASRLEASSRSRAGSGIKKMEQATDLYRGEFMADFSMRDCPDFDVWLRKKREDLHRSVVALLEKISSHHEQAGNYDKALRSALRHADLDPWNESALRVVMRLYALNGQVEAALGRYDAFTRLLEDELRASPSDQTRQLAQSIHNGESMRGGTVAAVNAAPASAPPVLPVSPPRSRAGRRQVTALACEFSLPEIEDPDEAMELLHARETRCLEIIRRFSGHVVRTHGGALLAYFGFPQANDRAAYHAAQAALAVAGDPGGGGDIRAGVHTGFVVSGPDPSVPDAAGSTSRLAIELSRVARPNEVAISSDLHGMVSGYFNCVSAGSQVLPGVAQPVEIFKVIGASGARTRLDAVAQLTPLAGRRSEFAQLLHLWKQAAGGERQVVLVMGDPGIGKSRLLHALKDRLSDTPHSIREMLCFPEFSQSPFYPLIAMLESLFGFARGDASELKSHKLTTYLEAHYPAAGGEAVQLLAQLLSLPLSGSYPAPGYSPQKQKDQTIAILLGLLQALAAKQPVLLILEDLHWIDPSTLELLTRFVEQPESGRVLAVLTARPEFDPPWDKKHEISLAMTPLAKDEVEAMIASINKDIPAAAMRRIVERADGVPLFVEEMVKIPSLSTPAGSSDCIPATLHGLLAMRMDSIGEAGHMAQLAAIIGREFDVGLLRRLVPDPAALKGSLRALQEAELVFQVDDTTWKFKHSLIQEAAYQSQARSVRQAAHRRIAQTLLGEFPEVVANRPELIARHLSAGGEERSSTEYWIKAGQRAAMNSANAEAREHFDSGLRLLPSLRPGEQRDHLEATLQLNLGTLLVATTGYGSAQAGEAYARALALCEKQGAAAGLFQALWGMWLTSSSRIGHAHSLELAGKLLQQAEQTNDVLQLQSAHHAMGNSSFFTGHPGAARRHLERSIALYEESHHDAMVREYGENVCVSSHALLSLVLWLLGLRRQADLASRRAIALARQVEHPNSLGYALCAAAMLNRWQGRIESTTPLTQEAMALADRHGLPFWLGMGAASDGWAQAMQGQAAGVTQIRQCLAGVNAVMSGAITMFLAPLCEALVHLGQWQDALDTIDEALDVIAGNHDRFFESEFHRMRGVCLLELCAGNAAEAEACFDRAIAISRRQGARSLEMRAAKSLAKAGRNGTKSRP
jgi:DNA-binding SARP family transcriptional activator/class 3 adenylate cyclase